MSYGTPSATGLEINNPNENYNIVIQKGDKQLILDFNGGTLQLKGDLSYDEGAKLFFESLDNFFRKAIDRQVDIKMAAIKWKEALCESKMN